MLSPKETDACSEEVLEGRERERMSWCCIEWEKMGIEENELL